MGCGCGGCVGVRGLLGAMGEGDGGLRECEGGILREWEGDGVWGSGKGVGGGRGGGLETG